MQEQVYNDAEFLALKLVRIAALSDGPGVLAKEVAAELVRLCEQPSGGGASSPLVALVCVMTRQTATAFAALARGQEVSVDEFVERFEMHKLEQIEFERQEREFGDES